jgi:hypothetical protein
LTFSFPSSCFSTNYGTKRGRVSPAAVSFGTRGFPALFSGELSCRAEVDVWRRHLEPSGSAYRKGAPAAFSGWSGGNRPYRPGLPVRHFPVAFCHPDTAGSRLGGPPGSSLEHGGLPGAQPSARRRTGATRRILTRSANPRVAPRDVREGNSYPLPPSLPSAFVDDAAKRDDDGRRRLLRSCKPSPIRGRGQRGSVLSREKSVGRRSDHMRGPSSPSV